RRRAGDQRHERARLAVAGRGLRGDERLLARPRAREGRRRDLAAGVAVDAAVVDEEAARRIFGETMSEPGHGSNVISFATMRPRVTVMVVTVAVAAAALLTFAPARDPDLWWHLATGRLALATRS